MKTLLRSLVAVLGLSLWTFGQDRILFIRGGDGTVGFFEGGANEQGASIFDYRTTGGNHSWGELNAALVAEGFALEEVTEDPVADTQPLKTPTPVPLDVMDLSVYKVIVFGSNNAAYTAAQVAALKSYIFDGGAALFISDANFGQDWADAPSSDQHFLTEFGLTMNQDQGTYSLFRASDFKVPTHPIFNGVDRFDGEGVSPITRGTPPQGVSTTILSGAKGNVRRNRDFTNNSNQGPSTSNNANDGTLVVGTYGSGRIACHFDRNTFFNANGAGTNINRFDNEAYARNLFNWLADKEDFDPTADNYAPRVYFPTLENDLSLAEGSSLVVNALAKDPDSSIQSVELFLDDVSVSQLTSPPFSWTLPSLSRGTRTIRAVATDSDANTTAALLTIEVIGGSDVETALDRSGWALTSSVNNNQTGNNGLQNAIDGDSGTRWATVQFQTPGQSFKINFGQRELITRILLETAANPEDYPRGYRVRGSDDNLTFTEIISGAANATPTEIVFAEPVTYQYLEIEQTGSSSNRWWSIHEIHVFRPAATTVLSETSWRQFHFGEAVNDPGQEENLWGNDADADGDGLTTFEEFAFNLNPNSPDEGVPVASQIDIDPVDGSPSIELSYRQWIGGNGEDGIDYRANGISYTTQFSETLALGSWSLLDVEVTQVGAPINNGDGTETITIRLKKNSALEQGFGRLRVSE